MSAIGTSMVVIGAAKSFSEGAGLEPEERPYVVIGGTGGGSEAHLGLLDDPPLSPTADASPSARGAAAAASAAAAAAAASSAEDDALLHGGTARAFMQANSGAMGLRLASQLSDGGSEVYASSVYTQFRASHMRSSRGASGHGVEGGDDLSEEWPSGDRTEEEADAPGLPGQVPSSPPATPKDATSPSAAHPLGAVQARRAEDEPQAPTVHPTLFDEEAVPDGLRWVDSARSGMSTYRSGVSTSRSAYGAFGAAQFAIRTPRDGQAAGLAVVIETYVGDDENEISAEARTIVLVEEEDETGWWLCCAVPLKDDPVPARLGAARGYLPCTFLKWATLEDLPGGTLDSLKLSGRVAAADMLRAEAGPAPGQRKRKKGRGAAVTAVSPPSSGALAVVEEEDGADDDHSEAKVSTGTEDAESRPGSGLWRYNLATDAWECRDKATGEVRTSEDPFAEEWAVEDIDAFEFESEDDEAAGGDDTGRSGAGLGRAGGAGGSFVRAASRLRSVGSIAAPAGLRSARSARLGAGPASPDDEVVLGVPYVAHSQYDGADDGEISLEVGDVVFVRDFDESGWWEGRNQRSAEDGWLPSTFVDPVNAMATARVGTARRAAGEAAEADGSSAVRFDGQRLPTPVVCPSGYTSADSPGAPVLHPGACCVLESIDGDWGFVRRSGESGDPVWVELRSLRPDLGGS